MVWEYDQGSTEHFYLSCQIKSICNGEKHSLRSVKSNLCFATLMSN